MSRALIWLELTRLWRSPLQIAALAMLLVLGAASAALSVQWQRQLASTQASDRDATRALASTFRASADEVAAGRIVPTNVDTYTAADGDFVPDPRDPYVAGFYLPIWQEKTLRPLSGFATGVSGRAMSGTRLTSRPLNEIMLHGRLAELAPPGMLSFGRLDVAMWLLAVMPLGLCGLLGLGMSRERERSMRLTLAALRVPASQLLAVRIAVAGTLVALIAMLVVLVPAAVLASPGEVFAAGTGQWLALAATWLGLWLVIAAAVIGAARTVIGAAVGLLATWALLIVLLPGLDSRLSNSDSSSAAALQALIDAQRSDADDHRLDDDTALAAGLALALERPLTSIPACASRRRDVLVDYVARFDYDRPLRAWLSSRESSIADAAPWSPASVWRNAAEDAAGHSLRQDVTFLAQAADRHHLYRQRVLEALLRCTPLSPASLDAMVYGDAAPSDGASR